MTKTNSAKMLALVPILLAINVEAKTPSWTENGPTSDSKSYLVVCSGDALDPDSAEELAQSRCMSSAAKLGGVTLDVESRTNDSLTGIDSSEKVAMRSLHQNIQCNWTDRFLQTQGDGFRVWLRCAVDKKSIVSKLDTSVAKNPDIKLLKSGKATVTVASFPPAEVIVVSGLGGERVFNPLSNTPRIELRHGDERITVKYHGYQDLTKEIPEFENGASFTLVFHPSLED